MKYRLVAFLSGLALVVSVLFGLVGGVSFGLLLLRGFIGAGAFAVLGLGAVMIFERYLPGLTVQRVSPLSADDDEGELEPSEEYGGAGVDIVLPEEMPHHGDGDLEEFETMEDARPAVDGEAGAEEYSELESVGVGVSMPSDTETLVSDDFGAMGVDTLPNLDAYGGGTGGLVDQAAESLGSSGLTSGRSRRDVEVLGHETDPQEAAKAVRTWLKKDEV